MKKISVELLILISIFIISAFLRLWNIEGYPRWYCDEGTNAHLGLNMLEGVIGYRTWGPNFFPPLFNLIQGISLLLLGNNYLAVRLPAALFGISSIALYYLIAKKFLGASSWTLLATTLFSLGSIHINRMGLQHNASLFFILATTYLLLKNMGSMRYWFLLGFCAGLAFLSHYTGGMIAGTLILLMSFYRRRVNYFLASMLGAILSLAPFVLVGITTAPQWFVFDLVQQGSRTFNLFKILANIFISTPFGWEFKYPLGGSPSVIYGLTLAGALTSIYLLFTARRRNPMLISFVGAPLIGLILSKDIWWAFILYLYPAYTLSFAILLKECYRSRKIMAMLYFLVPPILQFLTLHNLLDVGSFYILLVLITLPTLSRCVSKEVTKFASTLAKALMLAIVAFYMIASPLTFDIPMIFVDVNTDKREMLRILNLVSESGDLVAVPSEFLPLISKGVEGVDIAHLAFCHSKLPQFLYWNVETYLIRFKPRYCDPMNYKAIVFTYDYGLPITEMTGKKLIDSLFGLWPLVYKERHLLFLNPITYPHIPQFNRSKFVVPFTNVTFAYAEGVEWYNSKVLEQGTLLLEFNPKSSHGWCFWKLSFPEPFDAHGELFILSKYNASTNLVRFVIKPIDIDGNEVLPWITRVPQQNDFEYASRFYTLGNDTIKLGGLIVGVDWSDPRMVHLSALNTTIKVYIEYIVLVAPSATPQVDR